MHLPTNALRRFDWWAITLLVAVVVTMAWLAVPAPAQSAGDEAPVARPRATATQSSSAPQSGEEALWEQILALRQLPAAPAGSTQPLEDPEFVKKSQSAP